MRPEFSPRSLHDLSKLVIVILVIEPSLVKPIQYVAFEAECADGLRSNKRGS